MWFCLAKLTRPEERAVMVLKSAQVHFESTGGRHYLPFHADFTVPALSLAIYIDGCYWHACPRHFPNDPAARRRRVPSREADRFRSRQVRKSGWTPFRVWECQDIEGILLRALRRERLRFRKVL